jgi:hypothetical protein
MLPLLVVALPIVHAQAKQPIQDETVVIAANKSTVAIGTKVTIVATITNVSNHPIEEWVAPGPGFPEMVSLIVHDEQQKRLSEKPPDQTPCHGQPDCKVKRLCCRSMVVTYLAPGKSISKSFDLSELYDLSIPGKYTVQVARVTLTQTTVMSNPIIVTVVM